MLSNGAAKSGVDSAVLWWLGTQEVAVFGCWFGLVWVLGWLGAQGDAVGCGSVGGVSVVCGQGLCVGGLVFAGCDGGFA